MRPRVAFAVESSTFGDSLWDRSEPDWHFPEKPIHLGVCKELVTCIAISRFTTFNFLPLVTF